MKNIINVIEKFSGVVTEESSEPGNDIERYILKSMWIMMLSEFEGSIKVLVEDYIDKIKELEIHQIHPCILLKHFNPKIRNGTAIDKLVSVYKENPKKINYDKFTQDLKPKNKSKAIEELFNSLGVFLSKEEIKSLNLLNHIVNKRDAIAHGNIGLEITVYELKEALQTLKNIFQMLKKKLN